MNTSVSTPAGMSSPKLNDKELAGNEPVSVDTALQRLATSREHLRMAMLPTPKGARGTGPTAMAGRLVDKVQSVPAVSILTDAVRAWWSKHPLNTATAVAAEASRRFAVPLAQRNPTGLILGAVAAGALLAFLKPWRWILRPALFAGLAPAIIRRVLKELPVNSLIRMFGNAKEKNAAKQGLFSSAPASRVGPTSSSSTYPAARPAASGASASSAAMSPSVKSTDPAPSAAASGTGSRAAAGLPGSTGVEGPPDTVAAATLATAPLPSSALR